MRTCSIQCICDTCICRICMKISVLSTHSMYILRSRYTLDYNQEANFWGAQTANHPELILPFLDTITYLVMPNAAERARLPDWSYGGKPHLFGAATACMGCGPNGQHSPSELGNWDDCGGCPAGFGGFRGPEFPSATGPFEGMVWFTDDGCRFVGGLLATNFIQYHDATRDYSFLEERIMPLLRGISDFYVSYAVPSNSSIFGPFGVRHGATADELSLPFTCSQEVCGGGTGGAEHNAMQDLAYARMVWTKLLEYTNPDPIQSGARPATASAAERAVWADSLRRLAPFKTVTAVGAAGQPNRTIFSESEPTLPNASHTYRGDYFWHANTGYPITHFAAIWPAVVVSRNSDPALVEIAKATLLTLEHGYTPDPDGTSWTPPNGYCLAWPGAARLAEADDSVGAEGLSGRYLLTRFGRTLNRSMTLSGWPHIMGGLEEMGAIDAVHSLLMLSDDGVLELFAGWPSTANASFETLRANGGFLVSSGYDGASKRVTHLEVVSEAGRWLTIASPWPGALCARNVTRGPDGQSVAGHVASAARKSQRYYRFETVVKGRYTFEPCGGWQVWSSHAVSN